MPLQWAIWWDCYRIPVAQVAELHAYIGGVVSGKDEFWFPLLSGRTLTIRVWSIQRRMLSSGPGAIVCTRERNVALSLSLPLSLSLSLSRTIRVCRAIDQTRQTRQTPVDRLICKGSRMTMRIAHTVRAPYYRLCYTMLIQKDPIKRMMNVFA